MVTSTVVRIQDRSTQEDDGPFVLCRAHRAGPDRPTEGVGDPLTLLAQGGHGKDE